ncbi:TonB-dependent siderophore receptor [Reyranella sp.]|uniref:TonB-dependent siderophore receptor n=1 Tax=Reyranella sp. TaxID=1929291 RepID=UPI003783407B
MAQEVPPDVNQQAQAGRTTNFNIPAQPLAQALTALGQQAGIQVAVNASAVAGKTSAAVSGTMTAERALQLLLSGTGISYRFTSPTMVSIIGGPDAGGAMQLDPVQVQGAFPVPPQGMIDNIPPPYAGGQVATGGQLGLLGNRPVMDTPFNQTNYTAKKAQDQQAKTVRDVLVDDPSVRFWAADGTSGADNLYIRGFNVQPQAFAYGGLFGMLPSSSVMVEMAERIELLKGPYAMLSGIAPTNASIGGLVNVVPKRAPMEDLTQVTASYASAGQFGGHADVARRFGDDKQFGVRVNGVYRSGLTAVTNNTDERALALIGLDFRGENVRLSVDGGYQYQNINWLMPYIGINPGVAVPWAPNARANLGQPWNTQQRKDLFGVIRAEVDMTEEITAYVSFGAHDSRIEGFNTNTLTVTTNSNGVATASGASALSAYNTILTVDAGVRARANTGPIDHEIAVTATTFENTNGFNIVSGAAFASNLYNPTIVSRPNIPTPAANKASVTGFSSLGIADTLTAAEKRIQLTAGLRLQQVTAANFNTITGARTTSYDQGALSPAVALVFKPWDNVSVYGNYIQALQQGTVVGPTFTNAGQVFAPFKSTQFETGVKVDWGKFTTTASLFQISQPSILTNTANNTQFLGGEQVNQGLELNVFGEPVPGVRLLGGLMLLNAVLTKTQGGLTDGWVAPFTPALNLNLSGEWDLPFAPGLTVNGRVVYTGSQYFDTTFPRRTLPEWTRFDLGARYAFENPGAKGKLLVARFDVENVFDANYWAGGLGATTLSLGMPRMFRVSLTADF